MLIESLVDVISRGAPLATPLQRRVKVLPEKPNAVLSS